MSVKLDKIVCANSKCRHDCFTYPGAFKIDNDFYVCSKECEVLYLEQQQHFFGVVIYDNAKLANYFGVSLEEESRMIEKDKKETQERLGPYKERQMRRKYKRSLF